MTTPGSAAEPTAGTAGGPAPKSNADSTAGSTAGSTANSTAVSTAGLTATPPAGSPTTSAGPPRSRYSLGSMSNMLRSLLVIGFFLLLLVAIVPRMSQVERPAVDAAGKAAAVATQTRWPVEMPTGLGAGWVATSATYGPGTDNVPTFTTVWKTPAGGDLSLKQAAAPTTTWLTTSVTDNPQAGTTQVGGRTLERYAGGRTAQISYVVRPTAAGALTLVATTNAGEDELKAFTAALRPVTPAP